MVENGDNFENEIPEEIKELLNKHYGQAPEAQDFEGFFSELESKIDKNKEINEIASQTHDIYESYEKRQVKLKELFLNLREEAKSKDNKHWFKKKKKILISVFLFCFLTLASIAAFNGFDNYNYIDMEHEKIDWKSLRLTKEQEAQIKKIENEWLEVEAKEKFSINQTQKKIQDEIKKDKPNLLLIDKYQRDILDKEVSLKREKARYFLEMRFLLDEDQTLKLLKQS